jgi:tetratricopeptide (TPR) repeat protein
MIARIVVAFTLTVAPAEPASPTARDRDRAEAEMHARKAEALVAQGRYDEAERELHSAYTLDSSPYHLFGLGMVSKLRGNCDRAIGFFERTLEALPDSELDDEARTSTSASAQRQIRACGGEPPEDDAEIVPPPVVPPAAVVQMPPPEIDRAARPWHRDPAGATLLAIGLAGIATGAGLVAGGVVIDRRASDADSASEFVAAQGRAQRLATGGIVATAVGAALVIGAVARYVVVRRRAIRATTRTVTASRSPPAASTRSSPR